MLSKLLSAFCAAIVAVALMAAPAPAYSPGDSVKFNRPNGTTGAKWALINHINRSIESTRRGQTIRIAVYSLDRRSTATRLIRAHRRGVNVRMVINGHYRNPQTERLKRVLGSSLKRRSYVRFCVGGCRGRTGPMHLKFFLFTKTGRSRNVVMIGSGNLTTSAAVHQWNDLITDRSRPRLHRQYVRVFNQLARKIRVRNPYLNRYDGRFRSQFYPRRDANYRNDPILSALRHIRCTGARNTGSGRTLIRINMSTWRGDRGVAIARKVARKANQGCWVRVLYGQSSPRVTSLLHYRDYHDRITVRGTLYDRNYDGESDLFTHQKVMAVRGNWAGDRSAFVVWTGSSNWSDGGLRGDELVFRAIGRGTYNRYVRNHNDIWRNGSYATTRYSTTRTMATTQDTTAFRLFKAPEPVVVERTVEELIPQPKRTFHDD